MTKISIIQRVTQLSKMDFKNTPKGSKYIFMTK